MEKRKFLSLFLLLPNYTGEEETKRRMYAKTFEWIEYRVARNFLEHYSRIPVRMRER